MKRPMTHLALHSLHGQIHRFTGVVDRFGGFPQSGRIIHTLCVRELRHAGTEQAVAPDHWWFRLREGWAQAGIEPGDTVLFTAKVQRCSKGWDVPMSPGGGAGCRRRQVIGLGGRIRDVVVTQRAQRHSVLLNDLQEQVRRQSLLLAEAEAKAMRLEHHRDALLREVEHLQARLRLIRACRGLVSKGHQHRSSFAREAVHNGGGFARLRR